MGKMSDKHIEMQEGVITSSKMEIWDGEKFADRTNEPIVHIKNWEDKIRRTWKAMLFAHEQISFSNPDNLLESTLLTVIWDMSQTAFDVPREIQVVIDDNDKLFISVGTPGYVDFKIDPVGMKLPIKTWIHTHPFGKAYFSGTDWTTIRTWKPVMNSAIVLGDNEYWAYDITKEIVKTVRFAKLEIPPLGGKEDE